MYRRASDLLLTNVFLISSNFSRYVATFDGATTAAAVGSLRWSVA